jgi:hypothetical protein
MTFWNLRLNSLGKRAEYPDDPLTVVEAAIRMSQVDYPTETFEYDRAFFEAESQTRRAERLPASRDSPRLDTHWGAAAGCRSGNGRRRRPPGCVRLGYCLAKPAAGDSASQPPDKAGEGYTDGGPGAALTKDTTPMRHKDAATPTLRPYRSWWPRR